MESTASESEKNWALFIHLSVFLGFFVPLIGFFSPILFWFVKKNDSKFIDAHGKEAANLALTVFLSLLLIFCVGSGSMFAITLTIAERSPYAMIIAAVLYGICFCGVLLYWLISSIVAAAKVSGTSAELVYRHKLPFRLLK